MAIDFRDENENLRRIFLSERLDAAGADAVSTRFAALAAGSAKRVLVDLTGVTFLASMGIRALVSNAKAQHLRGGRMVLFVGANAGVAKTLETTGIDALIPMFTDVAEAEKAALA